MSWIQPTFPKWDPIPQTTFPVTISVEKPCPALVVKRGDKKTPPMVAATAVEVLKSLRALGIEDAILEPA